MRKEMIAQKLRKADGVPYTDSLKMGDQNLPFVTRSLKVQNIPDPPGFTMVCLADMRSLIVLGRGRCVVIIE
jgi:hypothetical protein